MNLLDTPGHADFSEDTYRTLHAVDGAVMLLDCAKGVEAQTKKLFRVCRQRRMPIFTLVNKMDRPGRDPFDLIGEVESVLGIGAYPMNWPIFRSGHFVGVYDRDDAPRARLRSVARGVERRLRRRDRRGQGRRPRRPGGRPRRSARRRRRSCSTSSRCSTPRATASIASKFLAGEVSPMFFGSAINNFGLEAFLDSFCELMPPPSARRSSAGLVDPASNGFSGFVFKIQANMDRAHRDRVAFLRICFGPLRARDEGSPRPHRPGPAARQPDAVRGAGAKHRRRGVRRRRHRHLRSRALRDRRHAHRRGRA